MTIQAYTRTFCLLYVWKTFWCHLFSYWLSKLTDEAKKWWSNSIIIIVPISTDDCGYAFTTKNGTVSLHCNMACILSASSSHITIRGIAAKTQLPVRKILLLDAPTLKRCSQMDFKWTHNNGKDHLTNRKDPWAESNDLKRHFIEKSISKDLKKDLKLK